MSKLNIELKTSAGVKITNTLRQAIGILQLNNQELESYLYEKIEDNPLLELEENSEKSDKYSTDESESNDGSISAEENEHGRGEESELKTEKSLNDLELGESPYINDYKDIETPTASTNLEANSEPIGSFENSEQSESAYDLMLNRNENSKDLKQYLLEQIPLVSKDASENIIANYLLECIDERGYLLETSKNAAKALGVSPGKINQVLKKLQTLEPTGVFARNIQECLRLQLEEESKFDNIYSIIIDNLELVASYKIKELASKCNIAIAELQDRLAVIRTLNPKPGLAYSAEKIKTKIPDVYVCEAGGKYQVQINDDNIPRAFVNKDYYHKIKSDIVRGHEKDYVKQKYNEASSLVKAIAQRQNTLLRISKVIVKMQKNFFDHGIMFLEPLVISKIARDIDMHESTVSRVINNKFIATPRGIFAFKFFFSSSLKASNPKSNKSVSSTKAKELIKEMVENEGENILSDDEITANLQKFGINVSRRAVAKYRSLMNIPSSTTRNRQKKLISS